MAASLAALGFLTAWILDLASFSQGLEVRARAGKMAQ